MKEDIKKEKNEPQQPKKNDEVVDGDNKKKFSLPFKKIFKGIFISGFLLGIIATIAGSIFLYIYIFKDLPSPYALKDSTATELSTQIFDRNGNLLYEIFDEKNRVPIELEAMPDYVIHATIAIEDKNFYEHIGVSFVGGILRAIRDTYLTDELQGGSTLTQQLVKSALLTPERTIQRKLKEIVLAIWAERIYTKDEILEMYLNQVPYGGSAYGIQKASNTFFNKEAKDLTLEEASLLAGLPQAPSLYSPYLNPDLSKTRRNQVLERMYEDGYIKQSEKETAQTSNIIVAPPRADIKAPHFVFYIRQILEEEFGEEQVARSGLRVTTTLDLKIQQEAETILKEEIEELENYDVSNGAVLITRPPTGEILGMVGSVDYYKQPYGAFNVTTALRQPGSSIKPLNYAVGIDRGIVTASSIFLDTKTCFNAVGQPEPYCPKNYDGTFRGAVGLRYALANSYNIPAVKMLAYNGVKNFIASSEAFLMTTFTDENRYGLSLTLGGGEVRMTEMAQAFSSFSNRGKAKKLQGILRIEDTEGNLIYEYKDPNFVQDISKPIGSPNFQAMTGSRAISEGTAFIISHILQDNQARTPAFGATSELVIPEKTVSVKTGTTDDLRDNWTIGFTPNFLVATWVGNNDNSPMNPFLTSGVTGASPIWNRVMASVLESQPDLPPIKPASVNGTQVCQSTGVAASVSPGCSTRFEYLIEGTEDVSTVRTINRSIPVYKDTDIQAPPDDPNIEYKDKSIIVDIFTDSQGYGACVDCEQPGQ